MGSFPPNSYNRMTAIWLIYLSQYTVTASARLQFVVARLIIAVVGHASGSTSSARAAVQLACNGVCYAAQLLLLLVVVLCVCGCAILVEPFLRGLDCFQKLFCISDLWETGRT